MDIAFLPGASAGAPPRSWRAHYWIFAAAAPIALYGFEAIKIISFEATRAPNVSLAVQLSVFLLFYAAWSAAPRVVWALLYGAQNAPWLKSMRGQAVAIGIAGLMMSAAHMFLLAIILRVFHSPPGWNAGHLIHSFGEVWVGYIGFWITLYALASVVIFAVGRFDPTPAERLEVRQNGKTHSLGLDEIFWAQADGNYVQLHTSRGAFTLRKTLSAIAAELGPNFLRSHRGALVNALHVQAIKPAGSGDAYEVLFSSGAKAPLSRRRLKTFRELIRTKPVS